MNTIYKYPLEIVDEQELVLPKSAKVLTVKPVGEQICVYAIVDTEDMESTFTSDICIFGTGRDMGSLKNLSYSDTCVMPNGSVWHVCVRFPEE